MSIWEKDRIYRLREIYQPLERKRKGSKHDKKKTAAFIEAQRRKKLESIPDAHRHGKTRRVPITEYLKLKATESPIRAPKPFFVKPPQ